MLIKKGTSNIFKVMKGNTAIKVMRYVEPTPTEEYFLTFSSPSSFTLSTANNTKNWDGTLEYSTDKTTWNTWAGTSAISSSNDGKLYIRGIGNTRLGSSNDNGVSWQLISSNNDGIRCDGDIETLLDYSTVEIGNHPPTGSAAFGRLFRNCSSLVSAPDLTTVHCSIYCYTSSFMGTGIVNSPKIYAETVSATSFAYTFYNCYNLVQLAKLRSTNLLQACYQGMYYGCTKIKLSTQQTGEYQNEYRIPISGNGVIGESSLLQMFSNTGGTFADTPQLNTIYYTSNEVV